eukprot:6456117-Amphidinium_carterae.3
MAHNEIDCGIEASSWLEELYVVADGVMHTNSAPNRLNFASLKGGDLNVHIPRLPISEQREYGETAQQIHAKL